MTNKHVAKTGARTGQWVKCSAKEGGCRNKSRHVTDTTLAAVRIMKNKDSNSYVPLNTLTEKDVEEFDKVSDAEKTELLDAVAAERKASELRSVERDAEARRVRKIHEASKRGTGPNRASVNPYAPNRPGRPYPSNRPSKFGTPPAVPGSRLASGKPYPSNQPSKFNAPGRPAASAVKRPYSPERREAYNQSINAALKVMALPPETPLEEVAAEMSKMQAVFDQHDVMPKGMTKQIAEARGGFMSGGIAGNNTYTITANMLATLKMDVDKYEPIGSTHARTKAQAEQRAAEKEAQKAAESAENQKPNSKPDKKKGLFSKARDFVGTFKVTEI
jgi:hypothetical protein